MQSFLTEIPALESADKPGLHKPKNQWFLDLLFAARPGCVLAMPYQEFVDSLRFTMPDYSHRRPNHATKHSSWWNSVTKKEALGSEDESKLDWEKFFRPRDGAVNGFDCLHAILRGAIMTTENEIDYYRASSSGLDPLLRFPYILLLPKAAHHFKSMVLYNLMCCSPAVQLCSTNYAPISRQLYPSYETGRRWFVGCGVSGPPQGCVPAMIAREGDDFDVILYGPFGSLEVYRLSLQKKPKNVKAKEQAKKKEEESKPDQY
eukprot:g44983.t1